MCEYLVQWICACIFTRFATNGNGVSKQDAGKRLEQRAAWYCQ